MAKTEEVLGHLVKVGDRVWCHGYLWIVDDVVFEPTFSNFDKSRYVLRCHWSGEGNDPKFFNNNMALGLVSDMKWTREVL